MAMFNLYKDDRQATVSDEYSLLLCRLLYLRSCIDAKSLAIESLYRSPNQTTDHHRMLAVLHVSKYLGMYVSTCLQTTRCG